MSSVFSNLNVVEIFFLVCAITGGCFFVVRLALQFIGAGHDFDAGLDADGISGDTGHTGHMDADASFKLLTLHGLTSFLLMFGLVGFALYRQSALGTLISIAGAVAAGLFSVWVIGKLFDVITGLQSSGTTDIMGAVGSEGTVYLTIPEEGVGRVTINFKNRLREFNAVSHSKEQINTGAQIKVVWVNGNNLIVERI